METIPATYGFPLPAPGYLEAVKALCERHGTLYIADEVQTGLMRTGEMWAVTKHGIEPDILVTGKGLSGGMYPIAAVLVSEQNAGWLTEDGFAHISSFGGAELGCVAALKTLEICGRPETRSMVHYIADLIGRGLRDIQASYPDWFIGIRQNGVVMGLEFDHPEGAKYVMRHLYRAGVWAIFSTLDPARAAVQAGPADDAGTVRGTARPDRGRHRPRLRRGRARQGPAVTGARPAGPRRPTGVRSRQAAGPAARAGRPPTGVGHARRPGRLRPRAPGGGQATACGSATGAAASTRRGRCSPGRTGRRARSRPTTAPRCCGSPKPSPGPRTPSRRRYADWAVKETGFGVVEHKTIKNQACSLGILRAIPGEDLVSPRIDTAAKIVSIPRPAGVDPGADPVDQPRLQRLLQGHPGAADQERDRGQPAPDGQGLLRGRGQAARRGGRRGRGARTA